MQNRLSIFQSCEDNFWFILGFLCTNFHSVFLETRLPVKYFISHTKTTWIYSLLFIKEEVHIFYLSNFGIFIWSSSFKGGQYSLKKVMTI